MPLGRDGRERAHTQIHTWGRAFMLHVNFWCTFSNIFMDLDWPVKVRKAEPRRALGASGVAYSQAPGLVTWLELKSSQVSS